MTTPKSIRSFLKFKIDYLWDKINFQATKQEKITENRNTLLLLWHNLVNFYSVLYRMRLIGPEHFSQLMERHNTGVATLKHAICAPNVFKKLSENQITTNFIYVTSLNFVTISHINYWDQLIPGKISGNSGMVHFAEINQAPPTYSVLQYIGRVASPKLVPRNCLRYLRKQHWYSGEGDWSQNLFNVL